MANPPAAIDDPAWWLSVHLGFVGLVCRSALQVKLRVEDRRTAIEVHLKQVRPDDPASALIDSGGADFDGSITRVLRAMVPDQETMTMLLESARQSEDRQLVDALLKVAATPPDAAERFRGSGQWSRNDIELAYRDKSIPAAIGRCQLVEDALDRGGADVLDQTEPSRPGALAILIGTKIRRARQVLAHTRCMLTFELGILDPLIASDEPFTELIALGEWFGQTCDQLGAAIAYRNSRLARSQHRDAKADGSGLTFSEAATEFQKAMLDVGKGVSSTQAKNAITNARRRKEQPFKSKGKGKGLRIEAVSFFRWVRVKKDAHLDSLR